MKIAPLADVKARFSRYVDSCAKSPVIVTKNGRPTAMLVAVPEDEEDLERFILATTPRFSRLLAAAAARIDAEGGLEDTDFWSAVEARHARRPRRRRA